MEEKVEKPRAKRKPRPKGTGSIFQRKRDGRFVARVELTALDGSRWRREYIGRTEAEAKAKMQRAIDAGALRRGVLDTRPLSDFARAWLRSLVTRARPVKPTTLDGYERDVRLKIIPLLGHVRLCDLTPQHVRGWCDELLRRGTGQAATNRAFRCLSAMFSAAVSQGVMQTNPAQALDRSSRPAYRAPEADTLTLPQVRQLLAEVFQHRYGAMVVLAATTALRQSETVGLRWSDLDFRRGTVTVVRNMVLVGKRFHTGTTKTEASERVVALPAIARDALLQHRAAMRGENRDVKTGLVFVTTNDTAVQRGNLLKKVLRPALQRLGLPSITWHELRHSCATILIERGLPLEAVSRSLGHSSPTVTARVYDKAFRGRDHKTARIWDAALRTKSGVKTGVRKNTAPKQKPEKR